ncbi:MAG: hypothetical protein QM813_25650 [Verrucomicrobiota bacterium]
MKKTMVVLFLFTLASLSFATPNNATLMATNVAKVEVVNFPAPQPQSPTRLDVIAKIAPIFTASAMAILIYATLITSIRQKRADVYTADHEMYDRLLALKADLMARPATNPVTSIEADNFFVRFWYLQFFAYVNWRNGWIDDQLYASWLVERRANFNNSTFNLASSTYASSWKLESQKYLATKDFVDFLNEIMTTPNDICVIMKKFKPPFWQRLRRFLAP